MKDLDKDPHKLANNEIVAEKQVLKQEKLIGRVKHVPGLTLFEIDVENNKIRIADAEIAILFNGGTKTKMVAKPGCFYLQALNKANARRKFLKMMGSK